MTEILLYKTQNNEVKLEVLIENETIWLSQKQLCELFGRDKSVISRHIKNIFKDGELDEVSTVAKNATVQKEGSREITRDVDHYNLDMIISVGYRVNSTQATQFRIWATNVLKEYIIKGFILDDDRFKNANSMGYFDELQKVESLKELEEDIKRLK
jgi:hypothetical protein